MIAISYRREDSLPVAGRLYDRLEQRFGKNNVFMDFDSIRPGFDFRDQIKETIERSKVVIAVMGPHWLGEQSDGSRRIDDPADFVRLEVACALERGIPVIPVLINNTSMPTPKMLPADIQALAFRHALPLDSGLDFRQHAERLNTAIAAAISGKGAPHSSKKIQSLIIAATAVGLLIVAGLVSLVTRVPTKKVAEPKNGLATASALPAGSTEARPSTSQAPMVRAPAPTEPQASSMESPSTGHDAASPAISTAPAIVSQTPSNAPAALDIAGQGLKRVTVKKYNCAVLVPNALFPDAQERFDNASTDHIQSVNGCSTVALRYEHETVKRVYEKYVAHLSGGAATIDYKVQKDGWFVVSGDLKTTGYYTKGVRRGSDVLLLELQYDGDACNIPDGMLTEMSRKFDGSVVEATSPSTAPLSPSQPASAQPDAIGKESSMALPFDGVKSYVMTGRILQVNSEMIAVQIGAERWEVALDSATTIAGDLEIGKNAVTTYKMITPNMYHPFKTYSVTGTVLEKRDGMIAIQKGTNRWEIVRDGETGTGRVGEKVTIPYKMIALSVVAKEAQ